ncbi:hypothetical protein TRFO_09908 [Tritrichomonas foetus]|uniref:Uncharacterized protein n=1 Tax=Tritrichomonas foetus TaxID=1144522 RepID=A0A1J4JBF2_9EUKA|nr:hypothetical protein TRFO_09908 [Tritrichomonas foetus]|eukprot:OHS96522.1 hypothetical protein TRFO_09908 [Tritrichomonas foetus]
MIPKAPDYTPQLKSLQSERERIDVLFYATEAKTFRVLEHAKPFSINPTEELKELQKTENDLLEYYNAPEGSNIVQLFQSNMRGMKDEEAEKAKKLKELKEKLSLLEREHEELKSARKKITIDGSTHELRRQFERLRKFYEDFKVDITAKIKKMRDASNKLITAKKNIADEKLAKINQEVKELQAKKEWYENIPKYVKEHSKIVTSQENTFTIKPDFSQIKKRTADAKKKCQETWDRHKDFSYNFAFLFNKINALQESIERVTQKVNNVIEKENKKNSARVSRNWAVMAKNYLKYRRQKESMDEIYELISKEDADLAKEVEKQRRIANEIIPGTTPPMTVLQMRKLIVELSKEVSEETQRLNTLLLQVQEEHRLFDEASKKQIAELEMKTNTIKERSKQ